jgi:hypothetical protein
MARSSTARARGVSMSTGRLNAPDSRIAAARRLAWSIEAGEPIERPAIVACRYTGEGCG